MRANWKETNCRIKTKKKPTLNERTSGRVKKIGTDTARPRNYINIYTFVRCTTYGNNKFQCSTKDVVRLGDGEVRESDATFLPPHRRSNENETKSTQWQKRSAVPGTAVPPLPSRRAHNESECEIQRPTRIPLNMRVGEKQPTMELFSNAVVACYFDDWQWYWLFSSNDDENTSPSSTFRSNNVVTSTSLDCVCFRACFVISGALVWTLCKPGQKITKL